ncbi:hypothetical protein PQV03_14185 [Thermoanaerobacterium thermosaccharolyticum]|uniref:hypothetical protein n=1 Tax=Thermoanaerobacterium thermosaccharolyticum TaxID=1517 RepID=UPI003D27AE14
MNEYYLLSGYIIPFFYDIEKRTKGKTNENKISKNKIYKNNNQTPENYTFLDLTHGTKIYIAYHESNHGFLGNFVIKSNSIAEAYYLTDIIRGFYSVFYGWTPLEAGSNFYLKKLNDIPNAKWTTKDINNTTIDVNMGIEDLILVDSGVQLTKESLEDLKNFISKIYPNNDLCESLNHLLESRFLFNCFITNSYYECHYKYDRSQMPEWLKEKMFYENRYRYQTAFVAAFKGIESFFRVNDFKKHEIEKLFNNIDYNDISFDTVYIRRFEIFSGEPEEIKYGDLLAHFLKLRNTVAAHHNKKPPTIITEDSICEIQEFLIELITKALDIKSYFNNF